MCFIYFMKSDHTSWNSPAVMKPANARQHCYLDIPVVKIVLLIDTAEEVLKEACVATHQYTGLLIE